jgi:hypothetical protein
MQKDDSQPYYLLPVTISSYKVLRLWKHVITNLLGPPFGVDPQRVVIPSFLPPEVMFMSSGTLEALVILIRGIHGYRVEQMLMT